MIDWSSDGLALLAGLGGAAHCAAMCGPLTLGLGAPAVRSDGPWRGALLFNLGRVLAYTLAGAMVGAASAALRSALPLPAVATGVRFVAAALLGVVGIGLLGLPGLQVLERWLAPAWQRMRPFLTPVLRWAARAPASLRPLLFGLLWLLMPCGLVYSMLLVAAARGSAAEAALVMGSFGLGTAPALLALTVAGSRLSQWLAASPLRKGLGVLLVAAALTGIYSAWAHREHIGHDPHAHHHPHQNTDSVVAP